MNEWDAVSNDTPPNSAPDIWDAVSTPQRDKPPLKQTFTKVNTSPQYQQERQTDETPAEEPTAMQGVSPDLAAAIGRRRRRQQGQPEQDSEGELLEQTAASYTAAPEQVLQTRKLSDADIPALPDIEQEQPEEEVIAAPRTARPLTKRGGLKGSSIAIIVLCIAVIGLSAFSGLSIFHVVNFNIANFSVLAPRTKGLTSGQTEATNIAINADASATALTSLEQAQPTAQQIYTQATSGIPAIDDPLTDNRNGWDQFLMDWGGECTFVNAATYHIIIPNLGHSLLCTSSVLSHFNNFAMQVSITPVQGDFAALVFGQNANGYYSTDIHTDGEYALFDSVNSKFLIQGSSTAIKQGLNQTNVITIIVNNNQFYFYANGQLLMSNYLSNYVAGSIDVAAVSRTQSPVDIAFSNLKIWKL